MFDSLFCLPWLTMTVHLLTMTCKDMSKRQQNNDNVLSQLRTKRLSSLENRFLNNVSVVFDADADVDRQDTGGEKINDGSV